MYDTVVLSSGGFKGYCQLGSLTRFAIGDHLSGVSHWVGVSIGSVLSLLILCGYTTMDIYQLDLHVLKTWLLEIKLSDVQTNQGLLRATRMREFLSDMVSAKTGMKDPSFADFHRYTKGVKLTVVSCVLRNVASSIFFHSVDTHPEERVLDAVIASCCIPFVMDRVVIDGETHVDGGLGCPFPIEHVDDGIQQVLGIYVESINDISSTIGYLMAIMDIAKRTDFERQKKACGKNVTILEITCKEINPLDYRCQRDELFLDGWKVANDAIESMSK